MNYKHGLVGSREYRTWTNMITRCTNKNCHAYPRYGGSGISVCERWLTFSSFLSDMGPRPKGTTLDRFPDKNGNYEIGNCRWATLKEQRQNRADQSFILFNGENMCVTDWSKVTGVKRTTIEARISKGWPIEAALFLPPLTHSQSGKCVANLHNAKLKEKV